MIYMNADLDYCKTNKPELYQKYNEGKLKNLPGKDIIYDIPTDADIWVKPQNNAENVELLIEKLNELGVYPLR